MPVIECLSSLTANLLVLHSTVQYCSTTLLCFMHNWITFQVCREILLRTFFFKKKNPKEWSVLFVLGEAGDSDSNGGWIESTGFTQLNVLVMTTEMLDLIGCGSSIHPKLVVA